MKRLAGISAIMFIALMCGLMARAEMRVTAEPFDTLPFEIGDNGKIFVNAWVNADTVPLRFLFDTGAVDNILNINSRRALDTLNMEELAQGQSQTSTAAVGVQFTPYNNSIILGETEFQGVRFVLAPCAEDIDGIVGWNTLTGADFMLDYDKQQILLFGSGECEIEDSELWLPLTFVAGLPSVDISFELGGETYHTNVWLDSGSDRCLDLTTPYIRSNALEGKQKPWGISQIAGMAGSEARIEEVIAPMVGIGSYVLYQVPMGLNLSNAGAAANEHFGGAVGNNLL